MDCPVKPFAGLKAACGVQLFADHPATCPCASAASTSESVDARHHVVDLLLYVMPCCLASCWCVVIQVEVEVLVPLSWPSEPADTLRVVELSAPELSAAAAQQLMERVNGDAQLLAGCDVLSLLQHVSGMVEAHLIDVAAGKLS